MNNIGLVYVALVEGEDGKERVAMAEGPQGPTPLILPRRANGDHTAILDELRLTIMQDPTFIGKKVTIAQFSFRTDVASYDRRAEQRAHPRVSDPFRG